MFYIINGNNTATTHFVNVNVSHGTDGKVVAIITKPIVQYYIVLPFFAYMVNY